MANYNKLNPRQKEVMAEFMNAHQNLAKNLLPNCAQGKATSNRLWDELAKRLNSVGPPVKDVKLWKKAYADQKYQVKKKLSFNKFSKKQTGGGPYEEKFLTLNEELLIEAAGLEATVAGNQSVPTFGSNETSSTEQQPELLRDIHLDSDEASLIEKSFEKPKTARNRRSHDEKLLLLEKNIKAVTDFQTNIHAKVDRLLEIQERLLQMKEEKHNDYMAISKLELQIKNLQLENLRLENLQNNMQKSK